jgi:hypothetical protein
MSAITISTKDILRPYQKTAKETCLKILNKYGISYLIGQLRTGKTLVSLFVAKEFAPYADSLVLFVTKKKVIPHVKKDFKLSGLKYTLVVINYEGLPKLNLKYKKPVLVIWDEAHTMGAFPKKSKRTKLARKLFGGIPMLYLSGTPSPESYSQLYHQLWISKRGPWTRFSSFYKWAKEYVIVEEAYIGNNRKIKIYKNAKAAAFNEFKKFTVTMTQKEAGFDGEIIEKIHKLRLPDECVKLIRQLRKKKFSDRRRITADNVPKLMTAIHQISSGTYIDDDENRQVISTFKADYIKKHFKNRKIAIFYCYIAEGEMLKKYFKYWTDDPKYFDYYENVPFICQIVSGREGIDLRSADDVIYFNISYSAVSYWQGRARSQSIDGGDKLVHFLLTDLGIEQDIYKTVRSKENFTTKHFDAKNFNI